MQKVTGIGGVFIKAKDPKALAAWYQQHLGIGFGNNSHVVFNWKDDSDSGMTVFSFFKEENAYFDPSEKSYMINFRVKDLSALLEELKKENVWMEEKTQEYDYGKFAWIMDPEGNKIELWEPLG
jgi:predicted enzyme related to lactoylglutathione lyase